MAQKYNGSCQCGNVKFEATLDLGTVMACNCSRCGRLGSLLAFAPKEDFTLISGAGDLTEYKFNNHVIAHQFCATCGIQPFAYGKNPKTGADVAAVNVRTLEGVDPNSLNVKQFDGKSL
jgi:hypothetical protein